MDTGYILSDDSKVEMVATLQDDGLMHCIFGVREVASGEVDAKGCLIYAGATSGNRNTLYAQFRSKQNAFSSTMADLYGRKCVYGVKTGGWVAKDFSTDEFPVVKSGTLNSSGHVTDVYSLYLFVLNNVGSAGADKASFRMYRLRIYEGDTLAMELLPHVDNGEVCLRDTVTGNILRNSGTGSFTFGTDE